MIRRMLAAAGSSRVAGSKGAGVLLSALCAGTLLLRPHPASAALAIEGAPPHAAVWRSVYREISDVWKIDRTVVVREVSDAEMEQIVGAAEGNSRSAQDDSIVDGCYRRGEVDENTDSITLRDSLRGEAAALVFAHEYGHFVWDNILSDTQRLQYRRIWREQKRAHHLVTHYAGDSAEEGWAEAFAYLQRKPTVLEHRDRASWKYLKAMLPQGTKAPAR